MRKISYSKKSDSSWIVVLLIFSFWMFFVVSWFKNMYEITQCDFDTPLKCEVLHGIAIPVAPLALYTAWADLGQ